MSQEYLSDYFLKANERARLHIEPLPLDAAQTEELCALLCNPPEGSDEILKDLIANRVPPGVDEAAEVKAKFLEDIALQEAESPLLSRAEAVSMLGGMRGGFNVAPLVSLLEDPELCDEAVRALEHTLHVYDAFDDVAKLVKEGNAAAQRLMELWAAATWFTLRPDLPDSRRYTVFKVTGEITTDDLSPAGDAWSRPDIPLHALAMFKNSRDGLTADEDGVRGPMKLIAELKKKGDPVLFAGDVVGTGSSRKSATNSLLYHFGEELPGVPNKKGGGLVIGGKIAPIFYNTLEDSGALPLEADVSALETGLSVNVNFNSGTVTDDDGKVLLSFGIKDSLRQEVRAGGRINLIIGRALTRRACEFLGCEIPDVVKGSAEVCNIENKGFTRAQKIVGLACGCKGVRPGQYVEVKVTTVGSQDTTGPMTRDELKDLACLKFSAPLVMQSFCHTCAYPKPVDVINHRTLPEFIIKRGGVALKPGDGVIHSWLNRMCLPNTVGTGGDSHTRMPLGISFPAGSGLVAFAAATGTMPLDMPESVLVRFTGTRRKGITLRDLVHAIPYFAAKQGLLTLDKKGKVNVFSGRILEIEGLEDLSAEHAFELADASAERSAAACAVDLSTESVVAYLKSNSALLRKMAEEGYESASALLARADAMDEYIKNPVRIQADPDCEYAAVLEINMDEITEPVLCAPNDPDAAVLLSECQGKKIDEIFIGSCMTNIGHYRAAASILSAMAKESPCRLWMAPPTRMDKDQLMSEGLYAAFIRAGARMETPGCSLCMGNQARTADNAVVVSTSTRNFPNRLGKGSQVYLASAELSAVCAVLGRLPTTEEYFDLVSCLNGKESEVYSLLNFASV